MQGLDTSWPLMVLTALTLGIRHGLDLDHLATINAITSTVRHNQVLSKCVGILFSLGHGLVVITLSYIIGSGLVQANVPCWLDGFGKWVAIFFLVLFGILNSIQLFTKEAFTISSGLRTFLARKKVSSLCIVCIGALFALSFDTISQLSLFLLSASLQGDWPFSVLLGVFFTLGMMLSDGLNSLFISTILQRTDSHGTLILTRTLSAAISLFSLVQALILFFS